MGAGCFFLTHSLALAIWYFLILRRLLPWHDTGTDGQNKCTWTSHRASGLV